MDENLAKGYDIVDHVLHENLVSLCKVELPGLKLDEVDEIPCQTRKLITDVCEKITSLGYKDLNDLQKSLLYLRGLRILIGLVIMSFGSKMLVRSLVVILLN